MPEGYEIRPLLAVDEAAAWCAAFEEAFADNYDPPTMSVEERRNYAARPDYLPEGDLVAVTADGGVAGVTWALRETDAAGVSRGWIWYIGVRGAHRGRGLARALLLRSLDVLRGLGLCEVTLAVDAGNESGALRLYESVGFAPYTTTVVYLAEIA